MAPATTPASSEMGKLDAKVLLLSAGSAASAVLAYRLYRRYLRRIRSILDFTPAMLESRQKIHGYVTRVGDGDNFRMYHTPGGIILGWGWLRGVPRKVPTEETLMVRLCGVDAPERAHWGKPAQPMSEEALQWLRSYIAGRYVTVTPYSIDQYKRVVARCQVWKWNGLRDVSAEMLRNGVGVVYEAKTGAEFGDNEAWYRKLENRAKKLKRGVWSLGSKMVTPGQYKKVYYRGE